MANLNKIMLIGRLTRDPEVRMFANGGKVVAFGFAVNNSRKNKQTGEWENDPVFIDVEAFNSGEQGQLADNIEKYFKKGSQAFIEGKLKLDQWESEGQKRSKLKIVANKVDNLDPREPNSEGGQPAAKSNSRQQAPARRNPPVTSGVGGDGDIPF